MDANLKRISRAYYSLLCCIDWEDEVMKFHPFGLPYTNLRGSCTTINWCGIIRASAKCEWIGSAGCRPHTRPARPAESGGYRRCLH